MHLEVCRSIIYDEEVQNIYIHLCKYYIAVLCVTSAFRCEPCRMFIINRRFGKHCSRHVQGDIQLLCLLRRWLIHIEHQPRKPKDKSILVALEAVWGKKKIVLRV
jgi:hypothetical protein